jgi:hypothetical protein
MISKNTHWNNLLQSKNTTALDFYFPVLAIMKLVTLVLLNIKILITFLKLFL